MRLTRRSLPRHLAHDGIARVFLRNFKGRGVKLDSASRRPLGSDMDPQVERLLQRESGLPDSWYNLAWLQQQAGQY